MATPPQHIIDRIAACERLGDPKRNSNLHEANLARDKAEKLRSKWSYFTPVSIENEENAIRDFHGVYRRYQRAHNKRAKNHRHEVPETAFIAGFQYYQGPAYIHKMKKGDTLSLERMPHNIYDHNALAVFWKKRMIGFVPRRKNKLLSRVIDQGYRYEAEILSFRPDAKPWEVIEMAFHRVSLRSAPRSKLADCGQRRKTLS